MASVGEMAKKDIIAISFLTRMVIVGKPSIELWMVKKQDFRQAERDETGHAE